MSNKVLEYSNTTVYPMPIKDIPRIVFIRGDIDLSVSYAVHILVKIYAGYKYRENDLRPFYRITLFPVTLSMPQFYKTISHMPAAGILFNHPLESYFTFSVSGGVLCNIPRIRDRCDTIQKGG